MATRRRAGIQDFDQIAILKPFTKESFDLDEPARVDEIISQAFAIATTGAPGPVHVNIPEDVLGSGVEEDEIHPKDFTFPCHRPFPDEERVRSSVELLAKAEKPTILAGEGVLRSGAWDELLKVAESLKAPVVTSPNAKGAISEKHELSVGPSGKWGACPVANEMLSDADAILAVGNRFGELSTASWTLIPPRAKIIQIGIDPMWLGRNYKVDLPILADAKVALKRLAEELSERKIRANENRFEKIQKMKKDFFEEHESSLNSGEIPINPARVVAELQRAIPKDAIVASETSFTGYYMTAFYQVVEAGPRFIQSRGAHGINYCLPHAIGAKAADPDKCVVAVCGDGGVGYYISELETTVRENLPIVVLVFNNGCLAATKTHQFAKRGFAISQDLSSDTDYAKVAEGFGAEGVVVDEPEDLEGALKSAISSRVSTLIDIRIDPSALPPILMV
jgi:acetolactate synthase-1/2/3 large subunit